MFGDEYTYLQSKRWRAISYDWETLSTYSQRSRLYCLTDFQAAWLLSNTEYMAWKTRWNNCPCTPAELATMKAEMEYNLMSCFDFQPYQLQTLYYEGQNALLTRYNDLWNGTEPSSVNPNAPDDFFDGDGSSDREDALCTALTLWAYSYAVDWVYKAGIVLGLAGFVTAIVDLMIPAGGNIATEVISHLIDPTQEEFEAMQDIDALNTVICDWKALLEGTVINASNWTTTVQSLSYTPDSPEDLVQQIFASDTQLLSNFLTFVNSLGKGYEYAQLGVFICACVPPCEVTEVWDFTVESFDTVWFERPSQAAQMEYVSGQGWRGSNPGGCQLITERYESITEVTATFSYSATPGEANPRVFQFTPPDTVDGIISTIPFEGNVDIPNWLGIAITRTSSPYTATLHTLTVVGCLR